MISNVVLVSTVQQNESAIHIHISPPFWTSFSFRSPVINHQCHFTNFLSGFFLKHHVFFCKENGVTVWLKMKMKILKWGNQIWSFRLPLFHAFIPGLANYGWWLNSETTWLPMLKMFTLWCFPENACWPWSRACGQEGQPPFSSLSGPVLLRQC